MFHFFTTMWSKVSFFQIKSNYWAVQLIDTLEGDLIVGNRVNWNLNSPNTTHRFPLHDKLREFQFKILKDHWVLTCKQHRHFSQLFAITKETLSCHLVYSKAINAHKMFCVQMVGQINTNCSLLFIEKGVDHVGVWFSQLFSAKTSKNTYTCGSLLWIH